MIIAHHLMFLCMRCNFCLDEKVWICKNFENGFKIWKSLASAVPWAKICQSKTWCHCYSFEKQRYCRLKVNGRDFQTIQFNDLFKWTFWIDDSACMHRQSLDTKATSRIHNNILLTQCFHSINQINYLSILGILQVSLLANAFIGLGSIVVRNLKASSFGTRYGGACHDA